MTKYEEIIGKLKSSNSTQAELMEEEIDIIIHKLKFLPADSLPTVAILDQKNNFDLLNTAVLAEKVKIAGGVLAANMDENPQVLLILQHTDELYQVLPTILTEFKNKKIRALLENKVFIIQDNEFQDNDETYVQDVQILAEVIQPKYFVFGGDGKDWVKFDLL